jgi:cytochrome c-type biogenesis protein CcmH/NrfF
MKSASRVCMRRYTCRMTSLLWLVPVVAAAGLAFWLQRWRRRQAERQRAAEERFAAMMAEVLSKRNKP